MKSTITIVTHGAVAKGRTEQGLTKEQVLQILQANECETLTRADIIKHLKEVMGISAEDLARWGIDPIDDSPEVTNALNTREAVMPKKKVSITEISNELAKPGNQRVIASVNEETGRVSTFLAPKPPTEGYRLDGNRYVRNKEEARNIDGVDDSHDPSMIDSYLAELPDLCHTVGLDQGARAKAQHRRQLVFRELEACVQLAEATSGATERQTQRDQQNVSSNNTLMQKLEQIRGNMRAIIESPAKA